MSKFQTHFNRKEHPTQEETNTLESMTIPDQSMTIEEIYRRFAQGRPVNIERQPVYDGDVLLPNWQRLDLAEREQLQKDIAGRIDLLRKDYKTLKTQYDAKIAAKKAKQLADAKQSAPAKPTEKPQENGTNDN